MERKRKEERKQNEEDIDDEFICFKCSAHEDNDYLLCTVGGRCNGTEFATYVEQRLDDEEGKRLCTDCINYEMEDAKERLEKKIKNMKKRKRSGDDVNGNILREKTGGSKPKRKKLNKEERRLKKYKLSYEQYEQYLKNRTQVPRKEHDNLKLEHKKLKEFHKKVVKDYSIILNMLFQEYIWNPPGSRLAVNSDFKSFIDGAILTEDCEFFKCSKCPEYDSYDNIESGFSRSDDKILKDCVYANRENGKKLCSECFQDDD